MPIARSLSHALFAVSFLGLPACSLPSGGAPDGQVEPLLAGPADEPTAEDGPILGVMDLDVVALIDRRESIAGDPERARTFEHFEYRFASDASLAAFLASPARYQVQLGGACARMGALSGIGSTELPAVFGERLYLFASEGCRRDFLAAPERWLAPWEDRFPVLADSVDGRGAWAMTRAWLGGDLLDKATLEWRQVRDVPFGGVPHQSTKFVSIGPDNRYREESAYDAENYVIALEGPAGHFIDPLYGQHSMASGQRRALIRRSQGYVFTVARNFDPRRDAARALTAGPVTDLWLSVDGFTHKFETVSATGEVLSHERLRFDPEHGMELVRREFDDWKTVEGVRVPMRWRERVGSEEVLVDRAREYWTPRILGIR